MKRTLLCALLSAALAVGLFPAAEAAAEDVPQAEKAAVLRELEVMVGDETGDLRLQDGITRAEFTKLLVAQSVYQDTVAPTLTDPYPDVSYRKWYAPYVRAAVDAGLVQGDLEGWFHPDDPISLGEAATMLVRLLGWSDGEFAAYRWPAGQVARCRALGLDAGVAAQNAGDLLTRQDCLHLFYNLLTVSTKQGTPYGNLVGCVLNQDGEVDLNALFQVEREGPVALTGDWQALIPFDVDGALIYRDEKRAKLQDLREWDALWWAKDQAILFASSQASLGQLSAAVEGPVSVDADGSWADALPFPLGDAQGVTRDGKTASADDLREGDLVYWNKYVKSLYAYSGKVWGVVEGVTPSPASPTAVTVAGRSYPLETAAAQYAFSELGSLRKGDAVTLKLGRTGGVAAAEALTQPQVQIGVVAAIGSGRYTDAVGAAYSRPTVTLTATDGERYTYPWEDDKLEVGDLVQVTCGAEGVQLLELREEPLTGRVTETLLAPDAEILDTYGDQGAMAVDRGRLLGVRLRDKAVRCYTRNEAGQVDRLILHNVTGDLHRYGVLTQADTVSQGVYLRGAYTYDIGGVSQVYTVSDKLFSVEKGPIRLWMDGNQIDRLSGLTAAEGVTLSGQSAVTAGGGRHTLAGDVLYYFYDASDKTYTAATRAQVTDGAYPLTAWYDAPDEDGGRVRIVAARRG